MVKKISKCRVCGNKELIPVVDLGEQYLTGIFPSSKEIGQKMTKGPLRLVKCHSKNSCCGLLQLGHTYSLNEMYGDNYGYRSGLNQSMVNHLKSKVQKILDFVELTPGDLVIDIGSNDATTLKNYDKELMLVGIDPTSEKFKEFYPDHIELIADFFNENLVKDRYPNKKAKVITSFSMFYDLEDPQCFVDHISNVLSKDDGIWVFEQSYLPLMLEQNSYDTICHEHLEYYSMEQIFWMLGKSGLKVIDVEINDVNGGSFSVVAANKNSNYEINHDNIQKLLAYEKSFNLSSLDTYYNFQTETDVAKQQLVDFIKTNNNKQRVSILGASTKGNVILQYCNITSEDVCEIGEVNRSKYGSFSPGTLIPIMPEDDVLANGSEYYLILPWHFRDFFINNEKFKGKKLVFPLPKFEIIHN